MSGTVLSSYAFVTFDNAGSPALTELLGVNNAGQVVGYFGNGGALGTPPTPFELTSPYTSPTFTDLQTVPGGATEATGIDNAGTPTIVGAQTVNGAATGLYDLMPTTVTATAGQALFGINDFGFAVGFSVTSAKKDVVVETDSTGAAKAVPIQGLGSAIGTGINNAGVIVGIETVGSGTEGFIYDPNASGAATLTTLSIPGALSTEAWGLNNQGMVVGDFTDPTGARHGFVYDQLTGQYTLAADDPNAHGATVLRSINDLGQIAGYYVDALGATHGMLAYLPNSAVTLANPSAGSTIEIGFGNTGVFAQGGNSVTLVDPGDGHVVLAGNVGSDTINAYGAADTIVGSAVAASAVVATGVNSFGDSIFLGQGANSVAANASATVVGTAGSDTITLVQGGAVFAGGGATTVAGAFGGFTAETVVGGTGSLQDNAGAVNGAVAFAGSGATTLVGGTGQSTLVGSSGSVTAFAGGGGGAIFGGTGQGTYIGVDISVANPAATTIVVGLGNSSVFTTANDVVFLVGSATNFVSDQGVSGNNETLVATASGGQNTFLFGASNTTLFAGPGETIINLGATQSTSSIVDGSGQDVFSVSTGNGGSYKLYNFKVGVDVVGLVGYSSTEAKTALAGARTANGSTNLTLSDGTKIDFVGTHPTLGSFD